MKILAYFHRVLFHRCLLSLFSDFSGKTAHAAAAPWEGINALDAAVACYNNVSMLRQQMKPTNRIHCTIVDGGERPNIIPERAEMWYCTRAQKDKDNEKLIEQLRSCAEGAAQATGTTLFTSHYLPKSISLGIILL